MKIKSHTGNMVEARVGMVVSADSMFGNHKEATIVELHDDKSATLTVKGSPIGHRMYLHNCTMLSCPFMVGDDVIVDSEADADRVMKIEYIGEGYAVMYYDVAGERWTCSRNLSDLRHTNPDLRAKGEV